MRHTVKRAVRAILAVMVVPVVLAAPLLTGLGCRQTKSCAPNTVFVTLDFSGSAVNDRSLTFEASLDGISTGMPHTVTHQPGVKTGSVELTFTNYKANARLELMVTPTTEAGTLAPPISRTLVLLPGCSTLQITIAPAVDGGASGDSGDTADREAGSGGVGTGGVGAVGGTGGLGGTAGTVATGGMVGSGGVGGGGGAAGMGGRIGSGGLGTGGGAGMGGRGGTGGVGTGGVGTGGMGTGGVGTGGAQCPLPACTSGATQCLSATSLQTCSTAATGCIANVTSTCPGKLLCERYAPADCVDPTWVEWPMPNGPTDVSAGAPNPEAYTDNGNGTVTDRVTALMWQKEVAPGLFVWDQAVTYCGVTLNVAGLAGYKDWRLPSRIELVSILDVGRQVQTLNTTVFNTPTGIPAFWSSSEVFGDSSSAWYVPFDYGGAYPYTKSNPSYVRCVR